MHSLMILHRSLMQKKTDEAFERERPTLNSEALCRRSQEREEIMAFFTARGLDKAARKQRQPVLRLIENCGSRLRMR